MEKITAHPDAVRELREAIRYYERQSPGLGRRLFDEVNECLRRILAHPTRYPEQIPPARRANLRRFPFHVNDLISDGGLAVVAVAQDKRLPFYWRERLFFRTIPGMGTSAIGPEAQRP